MSTRIRLATPEDIDSILAMSRGLAEEVGDPPPGLTAETFQRDAFGPEAWFQAFIAESAERSVGYALINRVFDPQTGTRGLFMTDLYVAPAERSRGLGKAIMQALARYAQEVDSHWMAWDVPDNAERARAFYESLGAEPREKLFKLSTMVLMEDALNALAADEG